MGLVSGLALVGVGRLVGFPALIALVVAVLASAFRLWLNMLDGMVAVADGSAECVGNVRGTLWNELPDRVSDIALLLGAAHSGLCHPLAGYGAAIAALAVAYVGTMGQAVGVGRRFEGWMSKPWRVATILVGTVVMILSQCGFAVLLVAGAPLIEGPISSMYFSKLYLLLLAAGNLAADSIALDLALGVVIVGSLDTVRRRLRVIVRSVPQG